MSVPLCYDTSEDKNIMTKLTASEAKSLTDRQYNKTKEIVIEETLEKIYSHISTAARKGSYCVELNYPNYGDEISVFLKNEGYKVKKVVTNSFYDWNEIIKISWRK